MTSFGAVVSRSALSSLLLFGVTVATARAQDLSRYRGIQFGTSLSSVTKQVGANPSEVKVVHLRPALIQELAYRPQSLGASSQTEAVRDVVFSFYGGELFRVVVRYDQYETEGLTDQDFVEAISVVYGPAVRPRAPARPAPRTYGEQEEVLARWEDPQYRFELVRSSYGPTYSLIGIQKSLEAPVQAAVLEATRLDNKEAPQREAARIANEEETARAKLAKARLVNRARFRP